MNDQNQRGIAMIIAMMAAILVMLAGKSCTDNMNRQREGSGTKNSLSIANSETDHTSAPGTVQRVDTQVQEYTMNAPQVEYVTDILGRVIGTAAPPVTESTEAATVPQVEYVTDILGRVIDVIEPETLPPETTEAVTYANPLEEYRAKYSKATEPADEKKEHNSAPSTIHITIG